jgi:hypothetical protein
MIGNEWSDQCKGLLLPAFNVLLNVIQGFALALLAQRAVRKNREELKEKEALKQ